MSELLSTISFLIHLTMETKWYMTSRVEHNFQFYPNYSVIELKIPMKYMETLLEVTKVAPGQDFIFSILGQI